MSAVIQHRKGDSPPQHPAGTREKQDTMLTGRDTFCTNMVSELQVSISFYCRMHWQTFDGHMEDEKKVTYSGF